MKNMADSNYFKPIVFIAELILQIQIYFLFFYCGVINSYQHVIDIP